MRAVDCAKLATITTDVTESTKGSFSITALEAAGFGVEQTEGAVYHAKKPISTEFNYSVMFFILNL